jgi:heat shock protein HtpX
MLIAAGEPVAKVRWYVLENPARNAFACGRDLGNGSIVVTRGLLQSLDRDELQAVLAHELAHLKNGDAQYVVAALAFAWMIVGVCTASFVVLVAALGLMVAAAMLLLSLLSGGDTGWIGAVMVLVIVVVFIYGLLLLASYAFCVALVLGLVALGVKAASSSISQSREFLADACSAQWTRNPLALATALAKISNGPSLAAVTGGRLVSPLWLDCPDAAKSDRLQVRLLSFLLRSHPRIGRRIAFLREMAGSSGVTDARRLAAIRYTTWQRIKEWALPTLATALAVVMTMLLYCELVS